MIQITEDFQEKFVCDVCHGVIKHVDDGNVVFVDSEDPCGPDGYKHMIVHSGRGGHSTCDPHTTEIGWRSGKFAWWEPLETYLDGLLRAVKGYKPPK